MEIENNIMYVKSMIEQAKSRSGRENDEIILVAVSKTKPVEMIVEAQKFGLNTFGENKVQELVEKYPEVGNVSWHLIGHLQKNKVKYIVDKVDMIHSLDSTELAAEINKRANAVNRIIPVLIQINIGREESKSGIFEEEIDDFVSRVSVFENLSIEGMMTIPPVSSDENVTRMYFRKMKSIFDKLKTLRLKNFNFKYLSMGMTDDFQIAIEEGANIVRIGTGIFGKRVYKEGQ